MSITVRHSVRLAMVLGAIPLGALAQAGAPVRAKMLPRRRPCSRPDMIDALLVEQTANDIDNRLEHG